MVNVLDKTSSIIGLFQDVVFRRKENIVFAIVYYSKLHCLR